MRMAFMTAMGSSLLLLACSSSSSPTTPSGTTTTSSGSGTNASGIYAKFQSAVSVSMTGSSVVLRSNGTPDHGSPYWGAGKALYETPHAGMQVNPNLISTQSLTLTVPVSPAIATASDTPMGPIGIAVNGVAIFNQYAAGRSPLTSEILSFDRYNGHPQQTGTYHYHMEPLWITSNRGASALIGVLLDGFPVYGPRENDGSVPGGLDSCNGHTHATAEVAEGIYHYHVTPTTPYISGCYRGTAGTLG